MPVTHAHEAHHRQPSPTRHGDGHPGSLHDALRALNDKADQHTRSVEATESTEKQKAQVIHEAHELLEAGLVSKAEAELMYVVGALDISHRNAICYFA